MKRAILTIVLMLALPVGVAAQSAPNLQVAFPEVSDSSPVAGGRFTLWVTVGNFGDGESAATTVRYYQSTDATISSGDTQVGTGTVGAVGSLRISQESIDLTAPATAGTYYYGACVDAVAGESNTGDNCSGSVTVEVVATTIGSDLFVHGVNRDDSTREPGETFRILVTVENLGDEWSPATTMRFYRSTDATITTSDTEVGTKRVPPLRHLAGSGRTILLTAPSAAGTYYYGACVDAVAGELDTTNNCSSSAMLVTVSAGGGGGGGGGSGGSGRGGSTARQSATVGSTGAATASELPGDKLHIDIHGQPDATFELGIGWVSRDGSRTNLVGVIRDQSLGQTYLIVRHEGYPQIVRRWVPPYSPLIHAIDWPLVIANFSFPVEIVTAIPLDHRLPEPNMLARRFDGLDDRIFAYDATLGQWRHIPDYGTFQAMGFYWCDVTAADSGFFGRISNGPPFPSSGTPILSDYPNCSTG